MSRVRAADLRFLLSHGLNSAVVLPGASRRAPELLAALRTLDVEVLDAEQPAQHRCDLVVATMEDSVAATAWQARSLVHLGTVARRRGGGDDRHGRVLFTRGRPDALQSVLPSEPQALRHYLSSVTAPSSSRARIRNRLADAWAASGVRPDLMIPPDSQLRVIPRVPDIDRPRALTAAADLGVAAEASWVLRLGTGDDLQRAVFEVLGPAGPQWVIKFGRLPATAASLRRDEQGLRLVAGAGSDVSHHAPTHLGHFWIGEAPASVETAARGRAMSQLLRSGAEELVPSIADWILRLGEATRQPAGGAEPELARLAHQVLPRWSTLDLPDDLLDLPQVDGVLAHHDLGSWNLIVDGSAFTAIDWESARPGSLPLWDLVYFLADALPRADGPATPEELLGRALALFRGQHPRSEWLFEQLALAADRLSVPRLAVGRILALCWLHHGLSASDRASALSGAEPAPTGHLGRMARPWMADPALGPRWQAWTQRFGKAEP